MIATRRATAADYPAVGDLLAAAYAPGIAPDQPYVRELRDAAKQDRDGELWVAELDGEVRGSFVWCPPGSPMRELAAADDEAEFRMLGVHPDAQGHGLGRALLGRVIALAEAGGYRRIVLTSALWMTTAHGMYQRAGFARTPERDWSPAPEIPLITFARELAPEDSRP